MIYVRCFQLFKNYMCADVLEEFKIHEQENLQMLVTLNYHSDSLRKDLQVPINQRTSCREFPSHN